MRLSQPISNSNFQDFCFVLNNSPYFTKRKNESSSVASKCCEMNTGNEEQGWSQEFRPSVPVNRAPHWVKFRMKSRVSKSALWVGCCVVVFVYVSVFRL